MRFLYEIEPEICAALCRLSSLMSNHLVLSLMHTKLLEIFIGQVPCNTISSVQAHAKDKPNDTSFRVHEFYVFLYLYLEYYLY